MQTPLPYNADPYQGPLYERDLRNDQPFIDQNHFKPWTIPHHFNPTLRMINTQKDISQSPALENSQGMKPWGLLYDSVDPTSVQKPHVPNEHPLFPPQPTMAEILRIREQKIAD